MNQNETRIEIRRNRYLNRLIDRMHNGLGKLVTGIRRCWKTYLLFNLFDDYLCSKIANGREQYYVFLDEAQYAISREELKNTGVPPRLYGVLNGLLRMRNVDAYVTGSSSKPLSRRHDGVTGARGRGPRAAAVLLRVHAGLRRRPLPGLGRVRGVRRHAAHALDAHGQAEGALPRAALRGDLFE